MSRPVPLPDPWTKPSSAECLRCGYSLAGISPPAPCPECGELFVASHFTTYGVPTLGTTFQTWQVILIVCIVIVGPFTLQIAVMTGLLAGWFTGLSLALVFTAIGVVGWLITRRRSAGSCRMVINGTNITLVPLKHVATYGGAFQTSIPLTNVGHVSIQRAGPFWINLQIDDRAGKRLFKAGIRCPIASEPLVREAIRIAIDAAQGKAATPSLTQHPPPADSHP